jgi:hypothetical protein
MTPPSPAGGDMRRAKQSSSIWNSWWINIILHLWRVRLEIATWTNSWAAHSIADPLCRCTGPNSIVGGGAGVAGRRSNRNRATGKRRRRTKELAGRDGGR